MSKEKHSWRGMHDGQKQGKNLRPAKPANPNKKALARLKARQDDWEKSKKLQEPSMAGRQKPGSMKIK